MAKNTFLHYPKDFTWGAITSSYQIEGAWDEDGKGVSIWDTFVAQPGKIERGETGRVAADHYHRWRADIDLMAQLGLKAYCFSISWPRIFPDGVGRVAPAPAIGPVIDSSAATNSSDSTAATSRLRGSAGTKRRRVSSAASSPPRRRARSEAGESSDESEASDAGFVLPAGRAM